VYLKKEKIMPGRDWRQLRVSKVVGADQREQKENEGGRYHGEQAVSVGFHFSKS
jgi:hypothetical protein